MVQRCTAGELESLTRSIPFYLRVTPDENFVFNIAEFPLAIERNGCLIARVPPIHDDEGRIYFNGDIYQGEKIRLTYAVPADLLNETAQHSNYLCDFVPEGIFLTICGNRTMFLNKSADEEIGFYRRFVPELVTNYGTSEIYSHHGQGGILNSALIAVGFREGEHVAHSVCKPLIHHSEEHNIIPLATRMAVLNIYRLKRLSIRIMCRHKRWGKCPCRNGYYLYLVWIRKVG